MNSQNVTIDIPNDLAHSPGVKLNISPVEAMIVLRNRLNLTQEQAAKRWHISLRNIRAWENKQTSPSDVNEVVIEHILNSELKSGKPPAKPKGKARGRKRPAK